MSWSITFSEWIPDKVLLLSITPHLDQRWGNYFSILLSPPQPLCFPSDHHLFFVILFNFPLVILVFCLGYYKLDQQKTTIFTTHVRLLLLHYQLPLNHASIGSLPRACKLHMPLLFLFFYRNYLPSQRL